MFLSYRLYLKKIFCGHILWERQYTHFVSHTPLDPSLHERIKAASSKGKVLQVVFLTMGLIQSRIFVEWIDKIVNIRNENLQFY